MGIFKKEKKIRSFVCFYCNRSINQDNEPNATVIKKDGKPVCAICRATKFSPMAKLINKGKIKYETRMHERDEDERLKALEEVKEIAFASQERAKEYGLRLSPKKFLK